MTQTDLVERLVELMPLALPRESWLLLLESGLSLLHRLDHGHGLGARSSATTLVSEGRLRDFRASRPFTQHNAQSRHAPQLEASVHSSLDLKHFTAGSTNSELEL